MADEEQAGGMHVLITGASGFVGTGVLVEALAADDVERVVTIGRRRSGREHPKLTELLVEDFADLSDVADRLSGLDACFWCLGTSSAGVDEVTYTKITHTFAMNAARLLHDRNPKMSFCFVSGAGADGSAMWAKVKKKTETDLGTLGFARLIVLRPAFIRARHPAKLRGVLYRAAYAIMGVLSPVLRTFGAATSNAEIGQAMIVAVRDEVGDATLDSREINRLASLHTGDGQPLGRRRRLLRAVGWSVAILLLVSLVLLALAWKPMGTAPDGDRLDRIHASPQWNDGGFRNPQPVFTPPFSEVIAEQLGGADHQVPSEPVTYERRVRADFDAVPESGLRVTWLGHSTLLLEIDGYRILIDPVWGQRTSPLSFVGPERWYEPPLPLDQLPEIDAVLISHDHYDHLDFPTVEALLDIDVPWLVPLGVGSHLEYWGMPSRRIVELDWWDAYPIGSLSLTCTPARHFSGRALPTPGTGTTLWSGWAVVGPGHRVYYSGDTSLFNGLVEVGERLGPFDLTMLEVGAYSPSARDVHLGPEQAVRAHELLRGKALLPVHWGLFALNVHGWTEPIERTIRAAETRGVKLLTPRPGQMVEPTVDEPSVLRWWPDVPWKTATQVPINSTDVSHLW
jgi:L-ascorbate metabolism protein UlaG (beta-lactamase superfamily)/uncharacterized protein YbjT (DUF2867 family)